MAQSALERIAAIEAKANQEAENLKAKANKEIEALKSEALSELVKRIAANKSEFKELEAEYAKLTGKTLKGESADSSKSTRVKFKPQLIPALVKAGKAGVNLKEFAASTGLKFGSMNTWCSGLKNMGILERPEGTKSIFRVIAGKTAQDLESAKPPTKKVEKTPAKKGK